MGIFSKKNITEDLTHCPECKSDWRDDLIPLELRPLYGNHKYFKREFGILDCKDEIVTKIICPDCRAIFRAQLEPPISHQVS